jgi:1-acyl-sn-glycerol-3-phosphate acyltransferase
MFFLKVLARIVLFFGRIKIQGGLDPNIKKAVMIFANHKSVWDGIYGLAVVIVRDVPFRFLIKKEAMFFPLNIFLKKIGAIAVDRKDFLQGKKLIDQIEDLYSKSESLYVLIEPEGTRKEVTKWKKGFYVIAKRCNIPIMTTFIDYKNRIGGFGEIFYLSENFEEDMEKLKNFYKKFQ